jgi:hypothetical protein
MSFDAREHLMYKSFLLGCILRLATPAAVGCQGPSGALASAKQDAQEDFDRYKLRLDTFWFYSKPTGSIRGTANVDSISIDLQKDLGFNTYSTFTGKLEWKFTRKNHLYVTVSPFYTKHETTLVRTFTFQRETFNMGSVTRSDLHALLVAPGYQYDIIRRKRGHLGIGLQVDLFDTSAKISAAAQTVNGKPQAAVSASGSLLAPIPAAGPEFRFYLTNSPRVFIQGNCYGMYLFGYGNFLPTADDIGVSVNRHISLNAGYQLGSRLVVKASSSATDSAFG